MNHIHGKNYPMRMVITGQNSRTALANIVTAFNHATIGSKVYGITGFCEAVVKAVESFDFAGQPVPGQAFIPLPEAVPFVSAGVGKRSTNPEDYVVREYRGHVSAYLKREFSAPCETCAVVVYDLNAYLTDPDITSEEAERIQELNATHVIVAILATAGPKPPYAPRTLVRNLAGANHEAATWTVEDIRDRAKASIEYDEQWATVAD